MSHSGTLDVNSVYENIVSWVKSYPPEMLDEELPEDKKDIEDVFKLLDWDKNVDPHYRKHYFRRPIVETETEQYVQKTDGTVWTGRLL